MNMGCFSRRPEFVTSTHICWLAVTCDTLFSPGSLHTCAIHSQRYTHIHINKSKPKNVPTLLQTKVSRGNYLNSVSMVSKTSYILSAHNGINTSILTGRNKGTVGKEQTKARPKANRESTKPSAPYLTFGTHDEIIWTPET